MADMDSLNRLPATCLEARTQQRDNLPVACIYVGTRAPHMLLERKDIRFCTCCLFGDDFVLLAGVDGAAWCNAALHVANWLGIRLIARLIGAGGDLVELDGRWPSAYDISSGGAVLVQPNGVICWRAENRVEHPEQALEGVLIGRAGVGERSYARREQWNGELSQNTPLTCLL